MRLLQVTIAALSAISVLAAKRSAPTDQFKTLHNQLRSTNAPVGLNDDSFKQFTAQPRNHTAAILLTALETRFACQMCQVFQPEWNILAKSWLRGDREGSSRLLFGTLDFINGRQTFTSLGLQTAPILFMFPPTVGPDAKPGAEPYRFDFSQGPQSAENVHTWISRHLPPSAVKPPVYRPFNYVRAIVISSLALGGITAVFVAWPYITPVLYNRNLWAALSLIAILLFTSGHMFNHIRSTPYISGNGKGGINYFAGGFQNQFGLESQIVAAMYAILAFATISLALKVPRIADERTQQVAVFIWGAVMFGMYSFLLQVFRIKNGGYPFWLPPFK